MDWIVKSRRFSVSYSSQKSSGKMALLLIMMLSWVNLKVLNHSEVFMCYLKLQYPYKCEKPLATCMLLILRKT